MKRIVFPILFLLIAGICSVAKAQQIQSFNLDLQKLSRDMHNMNAFQDYNNIEGTPYLDEQMMEGIFYQKNSPVTKGQTRLNLFRSSFEFILNEQVFLVDGTITDSVIYGGCTFVYKSFDINGVEKLRVLQTIAKENDIVLYKCMETVFNPEVKAGSYIDPQPARFTPNEPVYVLEIPDKTLALTSFKVLTKAFPEKEKEINAFIKKNKIKKDDSKGLTTLVGYLSENLN